MNIKFRYQYRDGANYKNHGKIIFTNNFNLSIEEITKRITNRLISGEFFYSDQFGVTDLHFEKWDNEYDHLWHEFVDVEKTDELNDQDDIKEFIERLEQKITLYPTE